MAAGMTSQGALMAFPVRCCALVGRFADARIAESVSVLLPHLARRGVRVLVSEDTAGGAPLAGVTRVPERELGEQAELLIAIGGDGTLLHGARLVARHGVPLLGVNRGRLGFLTDVMPQDMVAAVDAAIAGELQADERPLLTAQLLSPKGQVAQAFALNDVVMQKHETGRTLDFETRINGHYVNRHSGDGIIVASPTGSTAYALSCGGPIIEPHLAALVLTPICAHALSDRPIVVSARSLIEISLIERPETQAQVTCDGVLLGALTPAAHLEVRTAAEHVTLLHPPGHDYYKLLRSKLHWGHGSYER
jgi:NAD+ kinase